MASNKNTSAKNQQQKIKKTGSIARSINLSFSSRIFWIFVLMDLIFFRNEIRELTLHLKIIDTVHFAPLLASMRAHMDILIFQAVVWFFSLFIGTGSIRRRLNPLNELAQAAKIWSAPEHSFDEARFRDLEFAIENISPTREDARLCTGDKELSGLEAAVNNLITRMRDSYRQQARFVSDASHELRTPIAVIQGYANMLDRWGKEDETVLVESIDAIKSESEHMKHLVEQLLFLARGDSGHTKLNLKSEDLGAMMREVCEQSEMIDSAHKYTLRADDGVFARGDAEMLKQTARILADNAAKYSAEGETIILKAQFIKGSPAFTVQDAGVGMDAADVPHVFERFYRADSSRTRGSGGTGLGLSIAKWIVDKHGGWFEILSREDLGTRISVCLPKCESPAAPKPDNGVAPTLKI